MRYIGIGGSRCELLNVSFVNAFNAVTTVLFDATVDGSFTASIVYYNWLAVSQFAGLTFNPVDGLASHNW
jgi:hypothetical protein